MSLKKSAHHALLFFFSRLSAEVYTQTYTNVCITLVIVGEKTPAA